MKKHLFIIILLFACLYTHAQTPAFPGAEGGGMYTTGGRGGAVYYVNTLEDNEVGSIINKEGSLRWCLSRTGKRTILFKVSGTIRLNSSLSIKNGDVTIAGQSAPGDGICLADYPVSVGADNVIIRYMRFKMGDEKLSVGEADGADALGGRFFKNVIVDHCSVSWCTDECVSFYNCNNFTLQWTVISESLRLSKHEKGPHGYGGIWGGTNATFHHNLLAHHDSRVPRFGPGQNIEPHTETTDFRNNVIYNHGNTYGAEGMNINIVNNYYKPGPGTKTGVQRGRIMSIDKDTNVGSIRYNIWGQFYIDGNVVDDGNNEANCIKATNDNWTYGVYNQFASSYEPVSVTDKEAMKMSKEFAIKGLSAGVETETTVTTHTARNGYNKVLDYAGASLKRDSHDARVINEVRTGTAAFKGLSKYNGYGDNYPGSDVNWKSKGYPKAGIIDSQSDLKPSGAADDWTPWPILAQTEAPVDANKDGIPDGWLENNGYAGKTATELNEMGYTYLEVYLNSLVEDITVKQNTDAITGIESNTISSPNNVLKAFYDKTTKMLSISAYDYIESVSLYNLAGVLIAEIKGNDTMVTYSFEPPFSNFHIIKVKMKDQSVLTTKILTT